MKDYRFIADFVKETKKPFALTRLGDGEARVLNYSENNGDANFSFKKHLGYIPQKSDAEAIKANLIDAFNKSDIIGVPSMKKRQQLANDYYWRSAEEIMNREALLSKMKVRCSIDIHSEWLKYNIYEELLKDQPEVYIVTCRDVASSLEKRYGIGKVHQYLIDAQSHYEGKGFVSKHFPEQFYAVREWIMDKDINNSICLVGAGFVGKMYVVWFKESGGRAIDIGHVFDKWYGMKTRGVGGKVGVFSDEYKL